MGEKLFKVALVGAVVGVFILYLVSTQLGLTEYKISEFDEVDKDEEIIINGIVSRVTNKDKVAFLEIAQEEIKAVTVVLFKDREIDLSPGDLISVEGTIEEYKGKKEIIGNKVELK